MNVLHKPVLTPDEFERMPGTDGFELIDGVPREKSMGAEASWVGIRIAHFLTVWSDAGRRGWVFGSEGGYVCFPHRPRLLRKPDVSFVRMGRFDDERPPTGYAPIAPDLAAEVVSPNDLYDEIEERVSDFLRAGVPLVWVVDPRNRSAHAYQPGGTFRRLTADDDLTGDPVLPGFRVRIADLLPPPPAAPADDEPQAS